MPKKQANNAFYWFMVELKDKHPAKYPSLKDASIAAGSMWQRMTREQRRPYEEKTKCNKQNIIKYTTTGQSIAAVQKRENELAMKEQNMKDDIEATIQVALETGKLQDEVFHIIHVNYFCLCNSDKRYYPAEIGICRFSLQTGVISDNVFNMICEPGDLPLGYSAAAKATSAETHQIPPPMSTDSEYNMDEVAEMLLKFLNESNLKKEKMPPLYASKKNLSVVENILSNFIDDFDFPYIKVYSLEFLFFVLRNNCNESKPWASSSLSQLELEKDKYEFCREISCSYHADSDVPNHCSQSYVIRTVYTICDNCCGDINIDLIPGLHVPKRADLSFTRSQSRASSVTSGSTARDQPSRRHQPLHEGYLSHGETDYSEMSETSTVVDPNDFGAVGGLDTEYSEGDTDEWYKPKSKKKESRSVSQNSGSTQNTHSSQAASNDPPRRPAKLSAALTGVSNMSISRDSRGRGRGIAANFYQSKS